MDPRQNGQAFSTGHQTAGASNYAYSNGQTDPFNSFINTDDDAAFDNSWQPPELAIHQQAQDTFDAAPQTWQQSSFQAAEQVYPQVPQFNLDPRYQNAETGYAYPTFHPNADADFSSRHLLTHSPYPEASAYVATSLTAGPTFQYNGTPDIPQRNQTVAPHAIESYHAYPQQSTATTQKNNGMQTSTTNLTPLPNLEIIPLSLQDWRHLATRTVKSIDRPGWRIKPTNQFANVTNSKRFDGFIFVGNGNIAVSSVKGKLMDKSVPRYKPKKSRNEAMRLLITEKGNDPWNPERERIVKKLKVAARKQAPKKPTSAAAVTKSASSSDSSDSDSDDSSNYMSESEPEKEPDEPSPLPATRPVDPNKAVEYDLLKAVWAKKSMTLSGAQIRAALSESWDLFKGIRDRWKQKTTSLLQAIEKKDAANEKAFDRRVAEQRRSLEACIELVLSHGHPSIVAKLGENPVLLVIFYQFIADRFKDGEYMGSMITSILQLLVKCSSLDTTLLERTKLDKPIQRLLKRGDDRGKELAQQILRNAKSIVQKPAASTVSNGEAEKSLSEAVRPKDRAPTEEQQLSSKKDAEAMKTVNGNAVSRAAINKNDSKTPAKLDQSNVKPKTVNVPTKPSGFFSSLKSASKRPATATAKVEGSASSVTDRKTDASAPPSKPSFSFAATMADLAKQKDVVPIKPEESRKPESADEKRKRLRRESRRGLRVSFKADEDLVSIKTFVHDPEEELGHEDSQVRDVGDSKGEGQMLKLHKDLDIDDEEEYEPPEEIEVDIEELPPWTDLTATDFSIIEEAERERNYINRGGLMEIDSLESKAQIARESTTLISMYTSRADTPATPREPQEDLEADAAKEQNFGEPTSQIKTREAEYRARISAARRPPEPAPTPDITALLQIINNRAPNQSRPPEPVVQQSQNPLAAIIANLAATSANAPQGPSGAFNLQTALAGIQQQIPQQSHQTQSTFPTSVNPVPDLQAILAQINGQQPSSLPHNPVATNYNAGPNHFQINNDRKRQFEEAEDQGHAGSKKPRGGKPFIGVPYLPCKFFHEGKCHKGEDCTFVHDMQQ